MKNKIGYYLLRKKLSKRIRRKEFKGLESAKRIGILFDATDVNNFRIIKNLEKDLLQMGKHLMILGYVHNRQKSDQYISDRHFAFVTKKDFNWLNQPTEPFIEEFIDIEFDMLLVLANTPWYAIQYISQLSKAHFKVSKSHISDGFIDLTIDISKNIAIQELIHHILKYLRMMTNSEKLEHSLV